MDDSFVDSTGFRSEAVIFRKQIITTILAGKRKQ